ncbi:hypothetical protein GQ44DRAFT_780530 [Phaeosphaeriaceae sp. PMI808]|nr:hypothetical protein GQ44DRAFT_780530 [Phaeosphaeriaceae sp. PMI808]
MSTREIEPLIGDGRDAEKLYNIFDNRYSLVLSFLNRESVVGPLCSTDNFPDKKRVLEANVPTGVGQLRERLQLLESDFPGRDGQTLHVNLLAVGMISFMILATRPDGEQKAERDREALEATKKFWAHLKTKQQWLKGDSPIVVAAITLSKKENFRTVLEGFFGPEFNPVTVTPTDYYWLWGFAENSVAPSAGDLEA